MATKSLTIALLGVPNAGKSTLINAIVGQSLAAVHHKPQMTRRNLLGIHTKNNTQLIFIDTPGLHKPEGVLNEIMMQNLNEALAEADLVCVLLEADRKPPAIITDAISRLHDDKKLVLLLNKADVNSKDWVLDPKKLITQFQLPLFVVSALKNKGIDGLIDYLQKEAVEQPFFYNEDDLTTATCRDLVKEYIRQEVMEHLHQEIPYHVGVVIDSFEEKEKKSAIKAAIIVNRDSQKGMVIGKGGKTIDKIRKAAILRIKELMGTPITLSLYVKVDQNWIKSGEKIKEYF
ncbi:MAG: GTPase Era [bacterium]